MDNNQRRRQLVETMIDIRLHRFLLRRDICPLQKLASEAALDAATMLYLRLHSDLEYSNTPKHYKWAYGANYSFLNTSHYEPGDPI